MVGMFVFLCLASKKPSEREFFIPAGTDLALGIYHTVGFTIFPYIVALVQNKTYVECTKYVRRNTPAMASSRQPQTTNKRTMAVASGFCGF